MKKILLAALLLGATALTLTSCDEDANDDVVKTPNREGSIETSLATEQLNDSTVLTATFNVYKNGQLIKTRILKDTIPGLGTTVAEGEDSDGNDQKAVVPKQYEFYVTVK